MTFHRKKCGIEPQYHCQNCDKKFTSKYGLQVHSTKACYSKNLPAISAVSVLGSVFGGNTTNLYNWGKQPVVSYQSMYVNELSNMLKRLSDIKSSK
ncbi:hypothetical protein WA026_020852 [Henosepilachna vigintioctopunctata]